MIPGEQPPQKNTVQEKYARLAPEYDARWSFYVATTTRETIARLTIRSTDRILDVGCGTGALLFQLSASYPRAQLHGIDPVPEMLAVAQRRLPAAAELREGWAERIPYEDETFDVVVSCNMFHYVRQPVAAIREMSRVLRQGGQMVITDWCDDYLACRLCDWYLRLSNRAHVKVYRERELVALLERAGHPEVRIERYKINWLWGLMTASVTK